MKTPTKKANKHFLVVGRMEGTTHWAGQKPTVRVVWKNTQADAWDGDEGHNIPLAFFSAQKLKLPIEIGQMFSMEVRIKRGRCRIKVLQDLGLDTKFAAEYTIRSEKIQTELEEALEKLLSD